MYILKTVNPVSRLTIPVVTAALRVATRPWLLFIAQALPGWMAGVAIVKAEPASRDLTVTVRDLGANPLLDVAVYAAPVSGSVPAAHTPAYALIDQVNKQFVPLVTVIRVGTEVSFPNSDNMRHSIYSFSPAKTFTTKLYYGRQAAPVVFDKPGVVVLGCNIHDTMAAWVVIVDTPYFGKTAANGETVLKGLPAGDYHVSVWYPGPQKTPTVNDVHIDADHDAHLEMKIDGAGSTLPALRTRAAAPSEY